MRIRSIVLLLLLWTLVPAAAAQEESGTWYFAYNKDDGSLVAYNLAGTVHTLIEEGVTGYNVIGTRISDSEALLLLRVDENFGLYDATPDGIRQLVDEEHILQLPLATTAGAAVMVDQFAAESVPAFLFRDGALTPLPGPAIGVPSYARFSQDGRYFRFIGPDDAGHYILWDYDSANGERARVFDFGTDIPGLIADTYGESWVQRVSLGGKQGSYRLIHMDKQVEEFGPFDESQSTGSVRPLGEALAVFPPTCEGGCAFEIRATDGTETYQVDSNTFRGVPIAHIAADSLLVLGNDDQFYTVSTDAPPQLIGSFTRDQYHIFNSSFLAASPDGRWLMTVDDWENPTEHYLNDLSTGEVVASYAYGQPPRYLSSVKYGDGLVALKLNDSSYDFVVYDADGSYAIVNVPRGDQIRVYFELLPDHTALYRAASPYTGIYRHDLATGDETPLLEGAWEYVTMLSLR